MNTNYTSDYVPDFKFTLEDLEANRQGKLTLEQDALVASIDHTRRRDARRTVSAMFGFFAVLMVIGFFIELNKRSDPLAVFSQKQGILLLLITAAFLLILLVSFSYSLWLGRHARARRINTAEGAAHVLMKEAQMRGGSHYMRYELRIKRGMTAKLFRFGNARSIEFFEHGAAYRVYYIEYYPFQIVLSAEKI